jgi:hypothetical protein
MSDYSIVRVGNEYIVQAGDKSILKVSSRRKAVKLVTLATDLLDQGTTVQTLEQSPSISRDRDVVPDKSELPGRSPTFPRSAMAGYLSPPRGSYLEG